jgi:hypothetical protein
VAVSSRRLFELERKQFERLLQWSFLISRFGLYGLVFFVLRLTPRGDIPAFYFREAAETMRGLMPYRDFVSSYAPLHPYLDALVLRVWFSPLSIILLSICVECLVLPLWFRAGQGFFSEEEMRRGALWYVTSAISLQYVTIDGQDNVILAVLLALATLLLYRNRALLSGLVFGSGIAAVKFLPLIYAPAFFLSIRGRWRWAVGMAAVAGAVYGAFAWLGVPVFQPLAHETSIHSAGNVPYVIDGVTGVFLPRAIFDGFLLAVVAALMSLLAVVSYRASDEVRLRALTFCTVAITVAVDLFSKKSWPAYLMLCLFPMYTMIPSVRRLHTIAFAFLTLVAVVEHSYWAGYLDSVQAAAFHQRLMLFDLRSVAFLGIEILLFIFYGWILVASTREILALRSPGRHWSFRVRSDSSEGLRGLEEAQRARE